jgi:hypothetical protein
MQVKYEASLEQAPIGSALFRERDSIKRTSSNSGYAQHVTSPNHQQGSPTSVQLSDTVPPAQGSVNFSCSLDEYCVACKHTEATREKLLELGFEPGQRIDHIKWADGPKAVGFKFFEWDRVIRADAQYRHEL